MVVTLYWLLRNSYICSEGTMVDYSKWNDIDSSSSEEEEFEESASTSVRTKCSE